jgi:hypothetical protein
LTKHFIVATALLLGACSSDTSRMKSDWERAHEGQLVREESEASTLVLPPLPRNDRLVRFDVSSTSDFTFFIDAASVSVGQDRVVRYALVARSPNGVDNTSYEGMNCAAGEFAIYATGQDGQWRTAPWAWKPIEQGGARRWHSALYRNYFCPNGIAISDAAEGVMALKRGGHPLATGRDIAPSGR